MAFCNVHGCDDTEERPLLPTEMSDSDSRASEDSDIARCCDFTKRRSSLISPIELAEIARVSERIPPCYDYDGEAIDYFSQEVGPSIPLLWMLNVAMLLHVAFFFLITWCFRRCHQSSAYPSKPIWAWAVAIWLLPLRLVAEHFALNCALPPYVRDMLKHESYETALELKMFDISGFSVPSTYWVCYCLILTALDFADVITDVAYAGSMSFGGVDLCSHGNTSALWIHWWHHSAFHFLGIPCISLDTLSLLALILSLFQTVIPLATMLRKGSPDKPVKYERGDDGHAHSCITGGELYNDDVFFALGEAAGLESLKQMAFKVKVCNIERLVNMKKEWRIMGWAEPLSKHFAERFFLSYLLENGIQLNLQSWVLVINKVQAPSMPMMPILSVALSFFMIVLKLLEVRKFIFFWHHIEEIASGASVPEEERSKFEAKLLLFRRRGVAVVSATILLFLALCGACVTLSGIGRCPGEIHTWHGCLHIKVDIPANSS